VILTGYPQKKAEWEAIKDKDINDIQAMAGAGLLY
jgi:hypothetical protein